MKSFRLFLVVFLCISACGVRRGRWTLVGSPPCLLLVAWESYMTPSHMATHFFIAIRIRVKDLKSTRVYFCVRHLPNSWLTHDSTIFASSEKRWLFNNEKYSASHRVFHSWMVLLYQKQNFIHLNRLCMYAYCNSCIQRRIVLCTRMWL